ncbi:MAG: AraC family transcriptional regulator [Lachnospiraceae bacterium]|nr:AraC family transcriptional regulator [Lachnospiraceae bacterium]
MKREGVLENELGIAEKRGIWFYEPSEFALQHLYYPMWGAEYVCTAPYRVDRDYMDAFMFFSIIEGTMYYRYEGMEFCAGPGDFVFLDCHRPNCYWAEEPVRKKWIHFNGNSARGYHDLILSRYGPCLKARGKASSLLDQILQALERGVAQDHHMSLLIHSILADLADTSDEKKQLHLIQPAIDYICHHYQEEITVEQLSSLCNVSSVYLTRLFRQSLQKAPHEYLQQIRLSNAARLLTETRDSVESIAEQCGFSGSTHFIRMFRKRYQVTPLKFRKLF